MPVFGVAIHQTGSGIVEKALAAHADPFEYAVAYYLKPDSYFAHYVIGYDGNIAQIADEHERAPHIGQIDKERLNYFSGDWEKQAGQKFVSLWKHRWTGYASPAHLYPGISPNNAYVGMEMIPIIHGSEAVPMSEELIYTEAQHEAVAKLSFDIAKRWNFPIGWEATGRLACHEDVTPLTRMAKDAGWDPGVNRVIPWFNWFFLINCLRQIKLGAMPAL